MTPDGAPALAQAEAPRSGRRARRWRSRAGGVSPSRWTRVKERERVTEALQVASLMLHWYSPVSLSWMVESVAEMVVVMAARRGSFGGRRAARTPESAAAGR